MGPANRSKFSEAQAAHTLRQAKSATPVAYLCRQLGVSEAAFHLWKNKYANLGVPQRHPDPTYIDRPLRPQHPHAVSCAMTGDLFDSAPAPIAHYWRQAVDAFRAEGVLGRDVEVAKLAMLCARYQATGRRPRLLILGGPGTGKKLLAEATAAALRLPIFNHHASTLTGTGWLGKSVQDILDQPSARYGGSTLVIHGLEAVTVTRGAHGNTVDRVSQICTDLAVAATGTDSATAFVATANLPRLRIPRFGIIGAAALIEAGISAPLANVFNVVLHLTPLSAQEAGDLVATRALLEAAKVTATTGYAVLWSGAALKALRQIVAEAEDLGVTAGMRAVERAMDAALLNAMAMDLATEGRITISPEHVVTEGEPPALPWGERERDFYGGI